jgi:CRP/FNR family cyclic AMP-dependent transcriptional regulator
LLAEFTDSNFNLIAFLSKAGVGRKLVNFKPKEAIFAQGQAAGNIFYLQSGRAKISVVSSTGKEATVALPGAGDFIGEEAIATIGTVRLSSAVALNSCTVMAIDRMEMIRALHEHVSFADFFMKHLLARSMRAQADLVDQLFNSSEKRLARILLLMAEYGLPGKPEPFIPKISQETLAEMVGTTRSRVSFFMNRFREHGFIDYNGRIRVHKSLLNVVLHD